jgi:UDP:flavonoid glycosyltransferase YjiC (YdhE family)
MNHSEEIGYMKIVIATYGSRGDLQPLLALAIALRNAGHDVHLCVQPEDTAWVEKYGFPFNQLGSNFKEFLKQLSVNNPRNLKDVNDSILFFRQEIINQFKILPSIIEQADLALGASVVYALPSVAEYMHVPYRYIAFCPQFVPSSHHPYIHFSNQQMPPWLNRVAWKLGCFFENINFKKTINHERSKLGMQPMKDVWHNKLGNPLIVASDPLLGAIPDDGKIDCIQTGYFHLPPEGDLSDNLKNFITAGPKPVFIGFGSMILSESHAYEFEYIVRQINQYTQQRLIISGSTEFEGEISNGCYSIGNVPHSILFKYVTAVVHHGGAGTTATAARAGVPQIIIPHFFDQYYWAKQIFSQGLGPNPIHRHKLSALSLSKAIRTCTNNLLFQRQAMDIAIRLQEQDPLDCALKYIESI